MNAPQLLSDEPPLETEFHLRQLVLLIQSLEWLWQDRQDFYAFGNLTIYYTSCQGQLVPTLEEIAQQERQRAERLAQRLRDLGIDPSEEV